MWSTYLLEKGKLGIASTAYRHIEFIVQSYLKLSGHICAYKRGVPRVFAKRRGGGCPARGAPESLRVSSHWNKLHSFY